MNFTISSSELLSKLQIVGGAIGSNPVIPILEDFLFEIHESDLKITASNLETTLTTSTTIDSGDAGKVAIPGKILMDTLKALPDQPIKFNINDDNFAVEITSNYGKYRLSGKDARDYPEVKTEEQETKLFIAAHTLKNCLNKTTFATSNDELRVAMMGVYFDLSPERIIFVATDAHKLVRYTIQGIEVNEASTFIVPKKSLTLLNSALSASGDVEVLYDNQFVQFRQGDTLLISRLIDARYPDYNAVIPVDNPLEMTVVKNDLQSSLKRIAIYASKSTNQVVFNIQENSLTVSSQDLDFSNEAKEQLVCNYSGEPLTIGFNAKFLIEMLGILNSEEVVFHLSEPNRAGLLLPLEPQENEELVMLVMPVMMGY